MPSPRPQVAGETIGREQADHSVTASWGRRAGSRVAVSAPRRDRPALPAASSRNPSGEHHPSHRGLAPPAKGHPNRQSIVRATVTNARRLASTAGARPRSSASVGTSDSSGLVFLSPMW